MKSNTHSLHIPKKNKVILGEFAHSCLENASVCDSLEKKRTKGSWDEELPSFAKGDIVGMKPQAADGKHLEETIDI